MWTLLVISSFVLPFVLWPLRWWQYQRKLDRLEANIRRLRALATRRPRYRAPTPDDHIELGPLDALTPQLRTLELAVLGDLVDPAGDAKLAMRWFVDGEHTTYGMFSVTRSGTVAMLMSCSADRFYVTRMVPTPQLACPPSYTRQDVPLRSSLADVVAKHRALVARAPGLVACADLDAVTSELDRMREHVLAWREAQPPQALIDADVRAILGARFDRIRPTLVRRLQSPLPEARAL
jgi:hypothetical protein